MPPESIIAAVDHAVGFAYFQVAFGRAYLSAFQSDCLAPALESAMDVQSGLDGQAVD